MTRESSAPSMRTAPRRLRSASGLDGRTSAVTGARADIGNRGEYRAPAPPGGRRSAGRQVERRAAGLRAPRRARRPPCAPIRRRPAGRPRRASCLQPVRGSPSPADFRRPCRSASLPNSFSLPAWSTWYTSRPSRPAATPIGDHLFGVLVPDGVGDHGQAAGGADGRDRLLERPLRLRDVAGLAVGEPLVERLVEGPHVASARSSRGRCAGGRTRPRPPPRGSPRCPAASRGRRASRPSPRPACRGRLRKRSSFALSEASSGSRKRPSTCTSSPLQRVESSLAATSRGPSPSRRPRTRRARARHRGPTARGPTARLQRVSDEEPGGVDPVGERRMAVQVGSAERGHPGDGNAAPALRSHESHNVRLSPETRLGPYEIVSPLGAGGMGEVYRARDARLDRDVALKVLPEIARRAIRARSPVSSARPRPSPRCPTPTSSSILDLSLEGDVPYAVMELLEGETLADRIAGGPASVEARRRDRHAPCRRRPRRRARARGSSTAI